jgi:hypothetical protein
MTGFATEQEESLQVPEVDTTAHTLFVDAVVVGYPEAQLRLPATGDLVPS